MVDNCQLTSFPFINPNTEKDVSAVKISNIHFYQLHFPNSSPKNTLTCFDNIFNCWNFIVKKKKCFWGSLHIYKSSSNCENFLNWSLIAPIKKYRKIPNNFQKKTRYENIRLVPYRKIPVYRDFAKIPYRNKIPHTAGACRVVSKGWSPSNVCILASMIKIYIYWHKCSCDRTREDRATQPMDAGRLSFAI